MRKRRSKKRKKANRIPPSTIIIFSLMVLLSAIGLDYIGWKNGEKSYLFASLFGRKAALLSQETQPRQEPPPDKEALDQIVIKSLTLLNIPYDPNQQYKDNKGVLHLMIDLPLKKYVELESLLEKEFNKVSASVREKEEQLGPEKNYYLWQVEGIRKQRLSILFASHKEKIRAELPPRKARNKVAIIIDDMGYSLKAINDICSLNKPLTISILPYTPLAKEIARIAHQNNLEVMLHLPLESINNQGGNHIEGIILSQMGEEEILKTVEHNLDQIPYVTGVNNHMGSKITADKNLISLVLGPLKERNLFFIDSRTTSRSEAYNVAQTLGIPSAYRQVFLDGENRKGYIKGKMIELFRLAQRNGKAVGICHPTERTLRVLRENFHLLDKYNIEPVFASQLTK
ncbi:MAG: hypothetical protein GTO16_02410 [Candidatus Aminicenantes bacterium]|nr:hypothetical protein [Candidatus Aminicenantes bacterium]